MVTLLKVFSIACLIIGTILIVAGSYHFSSLKKKLSYIKAIARFLQVFLPGVILVFVGIFGVDLYPVLDTYDIPSVIMVAFYSACLVLMFTGALVFYDDYVLSDEDDGELGYDDAATAVVDGEIVEEIE